MNTNRQHVAFRQPIAHVSLSNDGAACASRRGNTLVLVAAVLALLAIIATAYITRTQSQRQVSVAQQSATMRNENIDLIAESLARHVADALFVWPIDTTDPALEFDFSFPASPNYPRKKPAENATRYGVDHQWLDLSGDGVNELFTFGYNHAPYHTVPFTNWPSPTYLTYKELGWDDYDGDGDVYDWYATRLPAGPGNPWRTDTIPGFWNEAMAFESNAMGNPGFGDLRWLADTEPIRWTLPNGDVAFSHWGKLSYIGTPNNSWRAIADISDVERSIITDLTIPIEQWPAAYRPNRFVQQQNATGDTSIEFVNQWPVNGFLRQWANWMGFSYDASTGRFEQPFDLPIRQYLIAYGNEQMTAQGLGMPSNFIRLSNLRAFGNKHAWQVGGVYQDRPESEFIRGTARHQVSRVMADTTGDGYTDAFWWDPGLPPKDGVRHIVAVRIEDNSSRLNANVATRFQRNELDFGFDPMDANNPTKTRTSGLTPTDLALSGQIADVEVGMVGHWNVGFYDNPRNWRFKWANGTDREMPYNRFQWFRHLYQTGLPVWPDDWNNPFEAYLTQDDRLAFWRYSARHGQSYQPNSGFQPFSLADELELRMHHGNNTSWILSDFERSVEADPVLGSEMFRAAMHVRHEQSEYFNQLDNRQLLLDSRRKMTMYSGARNDQLPPWLWWESRHAPGWNFDNVDICADPIDEPGIDRVWWSLPPMIRIDLSDLCAAAPDSEERIQANVAFRRFLSQSRQKLDLREYVDRYYFYDGDLNRDYYSAGERRDNLGRMNLRDRLAPTLMMALTDGPHFLMADRVHTSYYGDYVVVPEENEFSEPPDPDQKLLDFGWDSFGQPVPEHFEDPRYFRNVRGNLNNTRRLAASLAANILAYRADGRVYLRDRVLLPEYGMWYNDFQPPELEFIFEQGYINPNVRGSLPGDPPGDEPLVGHIGMDYQPFLVEAMIAHLHQAIEILDGEYMDFEAGFYHCKPRNVTMIMIEIANPFDVPISLDGFRISVFGKPVNLTGGGQVLAPHQSRVFYSIPDIDQQTGESIDVAVEEWIAQFRLDGDNAVNVFDLIDPDDFEAGWPRHRQDLEQAIKDMEDIGEGEGDGEADDRTLAMRYSRAIEIERFDPNIGFEGVWYVVDRIDMTSPQLDPLVHQQITAMTANDPPPFDPDDPLANRPTWYYDVNIVKESCDPELWPPVGQPVNYGVPHALQWVRISRAWQGDPVLDPDQSINEEDGDHYIPPNERNPRYVFGTRQVEVLSNIGTIEDIVYVRQVADRDSYYRHWPVILDQSWLGDPDDEQEAQLEGLPRPRFGSRMKMFEPGQVDSNNDPVVYDANGRFPFAMRMNLKRLPVDHLGFFDNDPDRFANPGFEQVGEVLNIWKFGHELEFDPELSPVDDGWYLRTRTTFAEFMQDTELNGHFDWRAADPSLPDNDPQIVDCWKRLRDGELVRDPAYNPGNATEEEKEAEALRLLCIDWLENGEAHRAGRLRTRTWEMPVQGTDRMRRVSALLNQPRRPIDLFVEGLISEFTWENSPGVINSLWWRYRSDPRHGRPALPAGALVLDAFVCDGPGHVWLNREDPNNLVWWNLWGSLEDVPNGLTDVEVVQRRRLFNANGFSGRITPGLININTATPEVMQALPHMARMVHADDTDLGSFDPAQYLWTWHDVPWAIQRYRERLGIPAWIPDGSYSFFAEGGPAYAHRGHSLRDMITDEVGPGEFEYRFGPVFFGALADLRVKGFLPGMRGDRGMASIGELTLLNQTANFGKELYAPYHGEDIWRRVHELKTVPVAAEDARRNSWWRIDYPTLGDRTEYLVDVLTHESTFIEEYTLIHPRTYLYQRDASNEWPGGLVGDQAPPNWVQSGNLPSAARLSTDVLDRTEQAYRRFADEAQGQADPWWPETAEDSREANLLFSGISNLVTTRSDVFTIYFRVRSFRQNPTTGIWDATDREHILDDARYVMLVDRSEVNRPSDKPRILYLERLTD